MGIKTDFEIMAKRVHEFANTQNKIEEISEMLIKLETVCEQACIELKEELESIKALNNTNGHGN